MSELRIELPPDVWAEVARRTGGDPAVEAQWVADAVQERLAALADLEARAARGNREAFERVLARVPATVPLPGDER